MPSLFLWAVSLLWKLAVSQRKGGDPGMEAVAGEAVAALGAGARPSEVAERLHLYQILSPRLLGRAKVGGCWGGPRW